MKKFNFRELDRKMNKSKYESVEEKGSGDQFLKLYEDIPPDPKMEAYVKSVTQQFDEKMINNRYHSYHLEKEPISDKQKFRLQSVTKLQNFEIGFQPEPKSDHHLTSKQADRQELLRKNLIRHKFRKNVKIVLNKLKKLKMTPEDVIRIGLFSKEPYKFGKEIFDQIKEGNREKVWATLLMNKLSIFSVDHTQKSPLMWACIRGHAEIAQMLIDAGSDINKEDQTGFNALYYAIKYEHPECVRTLMLSVPWLQDKHEKSAMSSNEKVRNVFRIGQNLNQMMKNLQPDKRRELFNEQYKYFYS